MSTVHPGAKKISSNLPASNLMQRDSNPWHQAVYTDEGIKILWLASYLLVKWLVSLMVRWSSFIKNVEICSDIAVWKIAWGNLTTGHLSQCKSSRCLSEDFSLHLYCGGAGVESHK